MQESFFSHNLLQVPDSFRFAEDSFLLADYAKTKLDGLDYSQAVDLGTGCGIVAFLLLEKLANLKLVLALDKFSQHIECARENAVNLTFNSRFQAEICDFHVYNDLQSLSFYKESFDFAITNPPWRDPTKERPSKSQLRASALYANEHTFFDFCKSANFFLKKSGFLFLISAQIEAEKLFKAMEANSFSLVESHKLGKVKERLLICGQKV